MLKKRFLKLGLVLLFVGVSALVSACEIHFKVSEQHQKEVYKPDDEFVVEVKIVLDHRSCDVDIADTKFTADGCKIIGATKWSQSNANTYHRKLKVKVLAEGTDMSIVCKRTCNKEGGFGKIELKKS